MPMNTIAGLFAKSPLQPLQKHMDTVDSCCHLLSPFMAAACQGDWVLAASHQRRIAHLAWEASQLKRGRSSNQAGSALNRLAARRTSSRS